MHPTAAGALTTAAAPRTAARASACLWFRASQSVSVSASLACPPHPACAAAVPHLLWQALHNKQFADKTLEVRVHKTNKERQERQPKQPKKQQAAAGSSSTSSKGSSAAAAQRQQKRQGDKRLEDRSKVLYVGNLTWATMTEDLQEHFAGCGGVADAFVLLRRDGKPSGGGFVIFDSADAAAAAVQVSQVWRQRALGGADEVMAGTVPARK